MSEKHGRNLTKKPSPKVHISSTRLSQVSSRSVRMSFASGYRAFSIITKKHYLVQKL